MLLRDDEKYKIHNCDCIPHMMEDMPPQSVDMGIWSPPFASLYAYSSDPGDLGNTDTVADEARLHLSFFYRAVLRVLKPGRVVLVHVCQIPRMKRSGEVGLCDFRGLNIRLGERAGLIYEYDWLIRKNPQAQAIRTRSRELQFSGLESDRAKSRGTIADYLIKFRAPGENAVPVRDWADVLDDEGDKISREKIHESQVSRNEWIDWAEAAWFDINETRTLNVRDTKADGDTKHICPLQLDVIERGIRLYSNPGETVFTPFAGIGSEVVSAIRLGRKGYGCELKKEYAEQANRNAARAVESMSSKSAGRSLFDDEPVDSKTVTA